MMGADRMRWSAASNRQGPMCWGRLALGRDSTEITVHAKARALRDEGSAVITRRHGMRASLPESHPWMTAHAGSSPRLTTAITRP